MFNFFSTGLPESDAKFYAMVVADTLDYMHRKNFIFRDLKPENILIDKDGYPILCDLGFGMSVVVVGTEID
jgi:serine/threonine protein kinase